MNQECARAQGRPAQILLVEDDLAHARLMETRLRKIGAEPHHVTTRAAALERLNSQQFDLLLLDAGLPDGSGFEIQEWLRSWPVAPPAIFVTADDLAEHAVQAMQAGAKHYVVKRPNYLNRMADAVTDLLGQSASRTQSSEQPSATNAVIGRSPAMVAARRALSEFAFAEDPILITGEAGTGKSLVSRVTHRLAGSDSRPLIVVSSCEIGPQSVSARASQLLEAGGGRTLVVERVEDATPENQEALLRLIETFCCATDGGPATRIVLESEGDLERRASTALFNRALWSRIRASRIDLPPLRTRREDIRLIATRELNQLGVESKEAPPPVEAEAWAALENHSWPGNVAELLFVVRLAAATAGEDRVVDRHSVRDALHQARSEFTARARFERRGRERLRVALDADDWNVSKTARSLNVTRSWLRRRMQALDLQQ